MLCVTATYLMYKKQIFVYASRSFASVSVSCPVQYFHLPIKTIYYVYCTYEGKVCVCDTSRLILLEGVNTATTNLTKAVNNTMWLALGTYELL